MPDFLLFVIGAVVTVVVAVAVGLAPLRGLVVDPDALVPDEHPEPARLGQIGDPRLDPARPDIGVPEPQLGRGVVGGPDGGFEVAQRLGDLARRKCLLGLGFRLLDGRARCQAEKHEDRQHEGDSTGRGFCR